MKFSLLLFLLFSTATFAGESVTVVKNYHDLAAHGLQADVIYNNGLVVAISVKAAVADKKLPDWMEAFYIAAPDAETAKPTYIFDMTKPNRVGVFIGWTEMKTDHVLIIGPLLRDGQTFKGTKYLAISVNDLIAWRGHKQGHPQTPAR
jgi:hypothetical protein